MKLGTTLALITAAVGLTALNAHAQTTEWVGNAELRYTSKYVFRGEQKTGQALQAYVDFQPLGGQNGFYVGGWYNQPFASERDSEFDLYGGYKYHYAGFVFDGGLTGYFYPEAGNNETDYTYEFNASASREIMPNWQATASLYYDVRLQAITFEVASGYRLPYNLEQFPASVDFSVFAGYSDINDQLPDTRGVGKVGDTYMYYGATISNSVWFTKYLRVTAAVQYGDTKNRGYNYGYRDGGDNLYGYVAVGVRW